MIDEEDLCAGVAGEEGWDSDESDCFCLNLGCDRGETVFRVTVLM